jgi:hypothetical protein
MEESGEIPGSSGKNRESFPEAPYFLGEQEKVARAGNNIGQYCMYQSVRTGVATVSGAHSCCATACTWSSELTSVS